MTAYEMRISDWSSDVCSSDLAARLPAAARRVRPAAIDQRRDLDPRAHRTAPASLLLAQRVEGTHRPQWSTARRRTDPTGLGLRRRRPARAGADNRHAVFPTTRHPEDRSVGTEGV